MPLVDWARPLRAARLAFCFFLAGWPAGLGPAVRPRFLPWFALIELVNSFHTPESAAWLWAVG